MNYKRRIEKLRKELSNRNLDCIFIGPDANMEYMAGVPRHWPGNTRQRQNSLEYAGLLITEKDVVIFVPRLTGLNVTKYIDRYPDVTLLVNFPDLDLLGNTFLNMCRQLGLSGKHAGILQDVSSSVVLMLANRLQMTFENADDILQRMRAVKDSEELALMRKASAITDEIYLDIVRRLIPGVAIVEIEREITRLCEARGAQRTSFPSDALNVGPGAGETIGANYPVVEKGYSIAFDFGVVYQGYCSDFGRTVFMGQPSTKTIKIHEHVMAAQQTGIRAIVAGKASGAEINHAAHSYMEQVGYGENFIHRLGHGIGKDVHERPFLADGEERVLESGMCFTVEPSIFIAHNCLVRVEDVILVTDNGAEYFNHITRELVVID
jgi:Xaa-Pro aminopeptidase